jgi:hypothetical protein
MAILQRCIHWCLFVCSSFAAVIAMAVLVFPDVAASSCGNKFYQSVRSPNDALQAVIFERQCGNSTEFSTHMVILPVGAALRDDMAGDVLISSRLPHENQLAMSWLGSNTLVVKLAPETKLRHSQRSWANFTTAIDIQFRPSTPSVEMTAALAN